MNTAATTKRKGRFWQTTKALFKKDMKDCLRNPGLSIMLLLPPVFGLIFRFVTVIEFPREMTLMMLTVMAQTMIPLSFLAAIIAEEKEKNTLRTLMLSGVTGAEFLASKMLVVWVFLLVVNVVDFVLVGYSFAELPVFLLLTALTSVCMMMIGAAIGILCRDQSSTSVMSVPLMMLLLLPSTMGMASPLLANIAKVSPLEHMMQLFFAWQAGEGLLSAPVLKGAAVILAWTVAGVAVYLLAYKRKRLDG